VENLTAPSIQQMALDAVNFTFGHSLMWYRVPAAASLILLLFVGGMRGDPKRDQAAARLGLPDCLYLVALAVFLFALRWPILAIGDLEGDESVAVSAAMTRYLDPAYGVTLFTGSAGPLLTYPVSGFGLLGLRIDFGASKLVSNLVMTASSAVLYLALRTFNEGRIARIALLPLLSFLGLASSDWTQSYCSEQWINLLVISMIYFLLRIDHKIGREATNLGGIGIAFGLMPLLKWQGIPMAALFALLAVAIVACRWRREPAGLGALAARLWPLVVLGLAPLLLWCAVLWSFGSLEYFIRTYFAALMTQATSRYASTITERLRAFPAWGLSPFRREQVFYLANAAFWVPAVTYLCLLRRQRRVLVELTLAAVYLVVSLYAVLQPGGRFSHYLNLLLQPFFVLGMLVFCRAVQAATRPALVVWAYLGLALLLPAQVGLRAPPLPLRIRPALVRALKVPGMHRVAPPWSPMILWGWQYVYYVNSGMTWGTRTGGSHEILEPFFRDKELFVRDFVQSLESGRAPVFLDTATEGSLAYGTRGIFGHANHPEIARAVRANYFLCGEFQGARLYLNRKRFEGQADIQTWCSSLPAWRPREPT